MKLQILRLICIAAAMLAVPAWASIDIEMRDGCPTGVVDTSPQPDCPANASCRNRGQTVHWRRADSGAAFSLNFHGAENQIFDNWGQGNCQSGSNPGGQLICRIADGAPANDYKYDVEADGCVLDPRLIIR